MWLNRASSPIYHVNLACPQKFAPFTETGSIKTLSRGFVYTRLLFFLIFFGTDTVRVGHVYAITHTKLIITQITQTNKRTRYRYICHAVKHDKIMCASSQGTLASCLVGNVSHTRIQPSVDCYINLQLCSIAHVQHVTCAIIRGIELELNQKQNKTLRIVRTCERVKHNMICNMYYITPSLVSYYTLTEHAAIPKRFSVRKPQMPSHVVAWIVVISSVRAGGGGRRSMLAVW